MDKAISTVRLWVGRQLVGLGFLIAPDAYWIAFATGIVDAKLDEEEADAALAEYNIHGGKTLQQIKSELTNRA
jgi:hypothetical protein